MKETMKFQPVGDKLHLPACPKSTAYMLERKRMYVTELDLQLIRLSGVKTILPNGEEIGRMLVDV